MSVLLLIVVLCSWTPNSLFIQLQAVAAQDCHDNETHFGCLNGGECALHPILDTWSCRCTPADKYYGSRCDELNPCESDPCVNGQCSVDFFNHQNSDTEVSGFNCFCVFRYTGMLCETMLEPPEEDCRSDPETLSCLNYGTCVEESLYVGNYSCACGNLLEGRRCEIFTDEFVKELETLCGHDPATWPPPKNHSSDLRHGHGSFQPDLPCRYASATCVPTGFRRYFCDCPSGTSGTYCDGGCPLGAYGKDCPFKCGQCANWICDAETGYCDSGGCMNLWSGPRCNVEGGTSFKTKVFLDGDFTRELTDQFSPEHLRLADDLTKWVKHSMAKRFGESAEVAAAGFVFTQVNSGATKDRLLKSSGVQEGDIEANFVVILEPELLFGTNPTSEISRVLSNNINAFTSGGGYVITWSSATEKLSGTGDSSAEVPFAAIAGAIAAVILLIGVVLGCLWFANTNKKKTVDLQPETGEILVEVKTTPEVDKATPGVGKETPGVGKATPAVGKATPAVGKATPGVGKAAPGVGKTTPGVGKAQSSKQESDREKELQRQAQEVVKTVIKGAQAAVAKENKIKAKK